MNLLYCAFDVFPGPKGAAAHIGHTLQIMEKIFKRIDMICLGTPDMPAYQQEGSIHIWRCQKFHPNFLKRTEYFFHHIYSVLDCLKKDPNVVQFRDIWSGYPLLSHPATGRSRLIFEVNGLTSIELPMRYTRLYKNSNLLYHFKQLEHLCLGKADKVVTVSKVNASYLQTYPVPEQKIRVIPNLADIPSSPELNKTEPDRLFYMGTLAPWQGITTLLKGFALVCRQNQLHLTIAASTRKFLKSVKKHIQKLSLNNFVSLKIGLTKKQIIEELERSYLSFAPLSRCDRNELQGCCPLKILESMALGVPVVASDLPVVRELIEHAKEGYLFPPGSYRALAGGISYLSAHPEERKKLAENGLKKIKMQYSRENYNRNYRTLYQEIY